MNTEQIKRFKDWYLQYLHDKADAPQEDDLIEYFSKVIHAAETDAKREENDLWLQGMRCHLCGGNKNPHSLTSVCTKCLEEA